LVSQGNGKAQTATELLAHAEEVTERQFADDPMSRGRLEQMLAIEYGNVQEYERSKALLQRAQASARSARSPALLSNVDCLLAATLGDQNEPQRAMALFTEAIERLKGERDSEGSVLSACLHMRADLNAHLGHPKEMLADGQAALAALGTPRPDQRVMANSIRIVIAEAYGRLGETAQAVAAYESSLSDLASMGRQQSARTVVRFNNFSRMLYSAGQARRAEEMAARGLEISRGSGGAATEIDAILEGNRARALIELGRFDEARALTEHALASALDRNDIRWAGTFALYGAPASCATGALERCASLLATAREKLTATLPAGHSTFGALEVAAAGLALARQQPDAARERLARAVALFDAASDKNPLRIRALAQLARLEGDAGDASAAAGHAATAVASAREASNGFASTQWLGTALLAQGIVQRGAGDPAQAKASLREALAQLEGSIGAEAPQTREARALVDAP
jgi:tetratricopeptide (TPR) repeat protein